MAEYWLDVRDFADIIGLHNANLGGLRRWATRIAAIADEVAHYVATADFGTAPLPRSSDPIRMGQFADILTGNHCFGWMDPALVFQPWAQWWVGTWSDGSPQFHIWDNTSLSGSQWVQPVTQSVTAHVSRNNFAYMLSNPDVTMTSAYALVDVGLNVCDGSGWVTGWVSKKQQGSGYLEMPHIGFSLAPGVLLWLTHPYAASGGFSMNTEEKSFFVFVEFVSGNTYSIRGRKVSLETVPKVKITDQGGIGHGDYTATTHSTMSYPYAPSDMPPP